VRARQLLLPIVLLAVSAYVHCAPRSSRPDPVDEDMPRASVELVDAPDSIEELHRRLAEVVKQEKAPGAVIGLVGRDGPIWVGGIGVRDVATRAPMQPDTVFRVGSVSKSLIALGVMRLHDQGKLDVDAPLRELLPGTFENAWEDVAPVTLAQCLEHTAGFDDIRFNEIFTDDEWLPVPEALALNPRSRIVRWRPGTRHGYSNVGYALAGRAIEAASGEPFDGYLRREILAPMGIRDADFGRTKSIEPRLAIGYQNGKPQTFRPFAHRPSASLLVSAEDLAKVVHFWIRRGDGYPPILSAASLARIERSGTLPYPHVDNQYGFANYVDVSHPSQSHGHDGGMPGFHASYRYFSDLGVGYVMLLNSNYSFRGYVKIRALLYAYLTRGRAASPPTRNVRERPGAEYFRLANPRNEISGFIERSTEGWSFRESPFGLYGRTIGGDEFELHSMPDGSYRFRGDSGSSVRFTKNADGTPIVLMSFMYGEAATYWLARLRFLAIDVTMLLFALAPLWAAALLLATWLNKARLLPRSLIIPPAITGLAFFALPRLLEAAFDAGVIGIVHPLTVAAFGMTIVLAVSSVITLASAIRWILHPQRPHALSLVIPTMFGVAFVGFTLWLAANGWIGLRTWAY
jgi:CubicO group peptidase (beta-lactamase class C family)